MNWKVWEGNSSDLIELLLSRHFPRGTEEKHIYSRDNRCAGRDSNRAPFELKSRALPQYQPARRDRVSDGRTLR
jgi:hypothetical protein